MKKYLGIGALAFVLLTMTVSVFATPIPGSINELVNGGFQTGTWGPWEHGGGLHVDLVPGTNNQYAARCQNPNLSLLLRQVVDETKNPLWNWNMNQKMIDLTADIMCDWHEGTPGHPISKIGFRFDWWGPEWNGSQAPPTAPAQAYSDWKWFGFSENENGIWNAVNPFVQDTQVLKWNYGTVDQPIWGTFQPRWLSVEVLIDQKPGERVWVDNLNLTAKCIPEPMSLVLGFMGLGSVVGLRRFVKK